MWQRPELAVDELHFRNLGDVQMEMSSKEVDFSMQVERKPWDYCKITQAVNVDSPEKP